jgi:N-acetylmuramoyl-L-alanine amidase
MKKLYLSPSTQEHNLGVAGYGTEEMRMNKIADYMEQELRNYATVIQVRRNQPVMTVKQVVADSNSFKPNLHLAIHSNAGGGTGCEVYRIAGGEAEKAAKIIYDVISNLTPMSDRNIKDGSNLYECNSTVAPAVLVEIAFHDNPTDANWIIKNERAIAQALVKAVLTYFGIPVKADVKTDTLGKNEFYRVQVGAFKERENAESLAAELQKRGYSVWITKN